MSEIKTALRTNPAHELAAIKLIEKLAGNGLRKSTISAHDVSDGEQPQIDLFEDIRTFLMSEGVLWIGEQPISDTEDPEILYYDARLTALGFALAKQLELKSYIGNSLLSIIKNQSRYIAD